jgi:hypothetical protein
LARLPTIRSTQVFREAILFIDGGLTLYPSFETTWSSEWPAAHTTEGRVMRGKGICYDTGFLNRGVSTHEPFDPEVVRRELRIVAGDLRCNAVRITGGDLERLKITASHAAAAGLEVWISPFTTDLTGDELLDFLAGCAEHAERLRRQGAEVVLLTGSELSIGTGGSCPARPSSTGSGS